MGDAEQPHKRVDAVAEGPQHEDDPELHQELQFEVQIQLVVKQSEEEHDGEGRHDYVETVGGVEDVTEEQSHDESHVDAHTAYDRYGFLLQLPIVRVVGEMLLERQFDDHRIHHDGRGKGDEGANQSGWDKGYAMMDIHGELWVNRDDSVTSPGCSCRSRGQSSGTTRRAISAGRGTPPAASPCRWSQTCRSPLSSHYRRGI